MGLWGWIFNRRRDATERHNDELYRLTTRVAELEARLSRVEANDIMKELREMAKSAAEILAAVRANSDRLQSQTLALQGLAEGHADIKSELADLKAQIAAGQTPDLSELETAVNDQSKLVDGMGAAIDAGTQPSP